MGKRFGEKFSESSFCFPGQQGSDSTTVEISENSQQILSEFRSNFVVIYTFRIVKLSICLHSPLLDKTLALYYLRRSRQVYESLTLHWICGYAAVMLAVMLAISTLRKYQTNTTKYQTLTDS